MLKYPLHLLLVILLMACKGNTKKKDRPDEELSIETSGNPIFEGWYADPEGVVFNDEYWVYPTYSDDYENQVFSMPFLPKIW